MIHFENDSWRARVDGDFTEENVVRVADAAGALWAEAKSRATVYVAYDTRPHAREFAELAASVLASWGLVAKLSDRFAPTPALAWAVAQDDDAIGGLVVTGSHHPIEYLGIKLRGADGGVISADFIDELHRDIASEATADRGAFEAVDFVSPYLDALVGAVDRSAFEGGRLNVVVDPLYGAARGYLSEVLRRLGVEVHEIHADDHADAEEMHPAAVEPWVDECEAAVVDLGARAGLVVDGDGMRVGAVDEHGRYVSPHKIISLVLGHLVRDRGAKGRVALGIASSALARRVATSLGCRVAVKPIGFTYIYEEMCKGDVLLGGEDVGGIAVPQHLNERDGLLANLLLCELMAMSGKTLRQLVDELESRFGCMRYGRRDVRLENEIVEMLRTLLPGLNPASIEGMVPVAVSHMDGLRLEFEDGSWMLLRPSSVEPVVRVYAEAPTVEERDVLLEAGCEIARGEFDK